MEQSTIEQLATETRRRAKLSDQDLLVASEIADRVFGEHSVVFGPPRTPTRLEGDVIIVAADHPDLNFATAHEIGERVLREAGFRGTVLERETAANHFAAALLAPHRCVSWAYANLGERVGTIARIFGLSQTAMMLRMAEVLGDDRAVVTRTGNVLTRGTLFDPDLALMLARGWAVDSRVRRRKLHGGIDEGRVALRGL